MAGFNDRISCKKVPLKDPMNDSHDFKEIEAEAMRLNLFNGEKPAEQLLGITNIC